MRSATNISYNSKPPHLAVTAPSHPERGKGRTPFSMAARANRWAHLQFTNRPLKPHPRRPLPPLQGQMPRPHPEVIVGAKYDTQIDMWSAGCTLYELAAGELLFTGSSNNDMLKQIQDLKGKLSLKQIKSGTFASRHFDESHAFKWVNKDSYSKMDVVRRIHDFKPTRNLYDLILAKAPQAAGSTPKAVFLRRKLKQLADLIDRCIMLDPTKRLTPEDALLHPFCKESMHSAEAAQGPTDSAASVPVVPCKQLHPGGQRPLDTQRGGPPPPASLEAAGVAAAAP
eukprot:Polyplicarium_translucidae@DN2785_c0_g1_i1.p1